MGSRYLGTRKPVKPQWRHGKLSILQAEEDYKKSVEALHVDTDKALEKGTGTVPGAS